MRKNYTLYFRMFGAWIYNELLGFIHGLIPSAIFQKLKCAEKLAKTMTETVSLATVRKGGINFSFIEFWYWWIRVWPTYRRGTPKDWGLQRKQPPRSSVSLAELVVVAAGRLMWGELIRRSTLTWEAYSGCKFTKSAVEPLSTLMDCSSISSGWTF